MSDAPRTAPRMSLGNLVTNDVLTAQFNPDELERTVEVAYARLAPMGHSHEVLQYQFRKNEKLDYTLTFDRLSREGGSREDVTALLDAMTVGSREAQDIPSGGAPDVLMLWPAVLVMKIRLTTLRYNYKRFASSDGTPTYFTVKVTVEESRTTRLYAEDIRARGLRRGT
jgi:hypothetical protein